MSLHNLDLWTTLLSAIPYEKVSKCHRKKWNLLSVALQFRGGKGKRLALLWTGYIKILYMLKLFQRTWLTIIIIVDIVEALRYFWVTHKNYVFQTYFQIHQKWRYFFQVEGYNTVRGKHNDHDCNWICRKDKLSVTGGLLLSILHLFIHVTPTILSTGVPLSLH